MCFATSPFFSENYNLDGVINISVQPHFKLEGSLLLCGYVDTLLSHFLLTFILLKASSDVLVLFFED